MTTDQAPDVPRRSRSEGAERPSTAPAWCAAWDLLANGSAHDRAEVILVMRKANPISYRTARELLNEAVRNGILTVVKRDQFGRPTLKRTDKLSPLDILGPDDEAHL